MSTFSDITKAVIGVYQVTGDADFEYCSDILNFQLPTAIKTIESLTLGGTFDDKTVVQCMVSWRNNKRESFRDTNWKRFSPDGFCAILISGVELKINIRMTPCEDVEMNTIYAQVKVSDKRFIRGMYLNANEEKGEGK